MTETTCLFCRIAGGELDADRVLETDRVVAFRDINPQAPVHVLVIPREHVASVADLEARHGDLAAELLQAAAELARREGLAEDGWRLVTNVGDAAGQTVPHLHLHVLGGRRMRWPPG